MTTRRRFLGALLAAGAMPALSWADAGSPAFLAAAREPDGGYALFGLTGDGQDTFRVALPARGHAAAAHPARPEAVAFARRPGSYALVLNCATGGTIRRLDAPECREFNGHGAFSQDGDTLFTSEVVAETGAGRIGVWSRRDGYARMGEFSSGGIGPHEIRRMPGTEMLVVANGGIRTGPGDREKLNLPTMAPNLGYLSPLGARLQQIALPEAAHLASIRHLAVNPDGLVAFAMQWEGAVEASPALLGLHRFGDEAATRAKAPADLHTAMRGYAGSVTFSADGAEVAISSPKGGRVQIFGADGAFHREIRRADVCGLAASREGFILTDGLGTFAQVRDGAIVRYQKANRAWDNHVVALDGA
jgi:uncharacterized protein